tara:strand:+ start:112 stop:414 length:303 start_codon:yes stop_codon:yes gene_type:complete
MKASPITLKAKNRPIIEKELEGGVIAEANRDGSTFVSKDASPAQKKSAIKHEEVHHDQMERGDLDYDDKNVYWKGKTYSRGKMKEGAHNLPWEAEAYKKS